MSIIHESQSPLNRGFIFTFAQKNKALEDKIRKVAIPSKSGLHFHCELYCS